MKKIVLCATMDTKAEEALFLAERLRERGCRVVTVDMGTRLPSPAGVDVTQREVCGIDSSTLAAMTRSQAAQTMQRGLNETIERLYRDSCIDGVIAIGGSGGCALASGAMSALPIGLPKLIVTTVACGNTVPYNRGQDIVLVNPIVDVQNLNFLTEHILSQAAAMMSAMCELKAPVRGEKLVAISAFGVTDPCVRRCVKLLNALGYEALTFHMRGASGGGIMEKLIGDGYFCGVLDVTTTEIADEAAGGIYAVGERRLRTAAEKNIPYVVAPGALDMINLGTWETLLPRQKRRTLYAHSPASVKMRSRKAEMEKMAEIFAERLGDSRSVSVVVPMKGFSQMDAQGQPFYDPGADEAFALGLSRLMPPNVPVRLCECHINDPEFADILVSELAAKIEEKED